MYSQKPQLSTVKENVPYDLADLHRAARAPAAARPTPSFSRWPWQRRAWGKIFTDRIDYALQKPYNAAVPSGAWNVTKLGAMRAVSAFDPAPAPLIQVLYNIADSPCVIVGRAARYCGAEATYNKHCNGGTYRAQAWDDRTR